MENSQGTGNPARIEGLSIAGKTGTAELKSAQEDIEGRENGWFVALTVDEPELLVAMMVEDVEKRGGSKYVVPKVRNIIESELK